MPVLNSAPQSGSETILVGDGTTGTITIPSAIIVDQTLCWYTATVATGAAQRDYRQVFTLDVTGVQELTWVRGSSASAETITMHWHVMEIHIDSLGASKVQRGRYDSLPDGDTDITIPTDLTDITNCITLLTQNVGLSVTLIDSTNLIGGRLTSTTNLKLTATGIPDSDTDIAWQVAELADGVIDVQRGTIAITVQATSNTDTLTSSVDMSRSFVNLVGVDGYNRSTNTKKHSKRIELTDADTVTAYRGGQDSDSGTDTFYYEAIEFLDNSAVLRGTLTLVATDGTETSATFSPKLDKARTVVFREGGAIYYNGVVRDNSGDPANIMARLTLDYTGEEVDSVTATRTDTGDQSIYPWVVIEMAEEGAPPAPPELMPASFSQQMVRF